MLKDGGTGVVRRCRRCSEKVPPVLLGGGVGAWCIRSFWYEISYYSMIFGEILVLILIKWNSLKVNLNI